MRHRGFTLIEVLVALAIAAIGLGAALSAVSHATANTSYLRDRVIASWVASNLLTEVRIGPNLPTTEHKDGVIEMAGRKWKWESEVTQTAVDGLMRIDITVHDADNEVSGVSATMTGFDGRVAVNATSAATLDPFDLSTSAAAAGGGTGGVAVPATAPVPTAPAITTKAAAQ